MSRILLLTASLLFTTGVGLCQIDYSLAAAEQALRSEDYKQATVIFDSLETEQQLASPDFYLALGNARFETGRTGEAILAYERGLRLSPANPDLINNLRYVREEAGLTTAEVPDFFLLRWWRVAAALVGTTVAFAVSLLLWWLAVGGVFWWYLRRREMEEKRRFALLPLAFTGVLLAALFFALAQSRYNHLHRDDEAILVAPTATLRVSPTESASVEAELAAGHKLVITDRLNRYVKVQLADGRQGYLLLSEVATI